MELSQFGTCKGSHAGNHSEQKLLNQDNAITDIGVNRTICQGCFNQIYDNEVFSTKL